MEGERTWWTMGGKEVYRGGRSWSVRDSIVAVRKPWLSVERRGSCTAVDTKKNVSMQVDRA